MSQNAVELGGDSLRATHKKPDWFGDGRDLPKMKALGLQSASFPDWAVHNEWKYGENSDEILAPDVRPPYSTEDKKHAWEREIIKLPPIKQKQQRRVISKAEKPFWSPKPEKSFKSPNIKNNPKLKEPEDVQMFNLISMQYQKDWIGSTKNKELERIRKIKQTKEQQKAKLLEHAVKRKNINSRSNSSEKEPFKLARFSNVPSRYLHGTTD